MGHELLTWHGLSRVESCYFCLLDFDDANHFLFQCPSTSFIWNCLSVNLGCNFLYHENWNYRDWILELKHIFSLILTICWFLWKVWNEFLFDGHNLNLIEIIRLALCEFSEGQELTLDRKICHWIKLPKGHLKINVDGSWLIGTSVGGVGYLIR